MRDSRQRPQRQSDRPAPRVTPERSGPARIELISVGRELLRGRIADRNAAALARQVTQRGMVVNHISVVDDDEKSISDALRSALDRNPNLVVTTGGLGPAEEDRTLAGVGNALGRPLTLDHATKAMVADSIERLRRRKFVASGGLTHAREKMCEIPIGSEPVANSVGVSPGVICRLPGGSAVLCLPGSPDEMQAVFDEAWPLLKMSEDRGRVAYREVESPTADESALGPLIERLIDEFPAVWITSRPAGSRKSGARIVIRLEATGNDQEEANLTVDGVVKRLLALAAGTP